MSYERAISELCALRVVDLISVDSEAVFPDRLSLQLPDLKSRIPQGHGHSLAVPSLLSRMFSGAFPFRFLDARALGSGTDSVGLSVYSLAESDLAKAGVINAWEAALPFTGISQTEAKFASQTLDELCFVGCVGNYGRPVFLSSDAKWPAIGILESELLASGVFYPEDIELHWKDFASFLMWYVSDVPANTGSSWRYVDDRHRQFRVERVS